MNGTFKDLLLGSGIVTREFKPFRHHRPTNGASAARFDGLSHFMLYQVIRKNDRPTVTADGLTDSHTFMVERCSGTAIGQFVRDVNPTLAERRKTLARGDPIDGLRTVGLIQLVSHLISYAYYDYILEAASLGEPA